MSISIPTAGELKHKIELFRRVDVPAQTLGAKAQDTFIWRGWAKIEPTGSAYWFNSQTEDKATHRFWIRSIPGITDSYSITHGVLIRKKRQVFRPLRVTDANGDGKWTVIEAKEVGGDSPEGAPVNRSSLLQESLNA